MGSVFTCKLNPCCGDRLNCEPPRQYDSAPPSPAPKAHVDPYVCPECGRDKALTVADVANGLCPKWWAIRDKDAANDCERYGAAMRSSPLRETQEFTLRAMAENYAKGHSWDHLDSEAVRQAADEIRALRTSAPALRSQVIDECAEIARRVENNRTPIPCPDGLKGCLVAHFRLGGGPVETALRALKSEAK